MQLYAITDRRLLPGSHTLGQLTLTEQEALLRLATEWAAAGVDSIQLREKDLPPEALTALATAMVRGVREASAGRTQLLVNAGAPGAAEAVRAAGAAGLHLPGKWQPEQVGTARITGMVSVGCHSVGEVAVARAAGADIALVSPIFPTASHPEAPALGLDVLAAACQAGGSGRGSLAVYALGGVDAGNAASCMAAGAAGVAAIRSFMDGRLTAARTVAALSHLASARADIAPPHSIP